MNNEQKYLLNMLKQFNQFCEEYQICYYLGGGAALGAVRHRGFIPWDDDIDLYITRKELQKLKQNKEALDRAGFVYLDHFEYPEYGNSVVRIVENTSTMFNPVRMNDETPKGSMIELFILDPLPDEEEARMEWKKKQIIYLELLDSSFRALRMNQKEYISEEFLERYLERVQKVGRNQVLQELEQELFSVEASDHCQYCMRWCGGDIRFEADWLGKPRYVPFEDTMLPILPGAENAFREEYGEQWMYFPENMESEHTFIVNYSIPYSVYIEDYSLFLSEADLKSAFSKKKNLTRKQFFARLKTMKKSQELHTAQVIFNLNRKNISLNALESFIEEGKVSQVREFFSKWEKVQFSPLFKNAKQCLEIGDEYLYYALMGLISSDRLMDAGKVLSWRKGNTGNIAKLEEKIKNICDAWFFWHIGNENAMQQALHRAIEFQIPVEVYEEEYLKLQCENNNLEYDSVEQLQILQRKAEALFQRYPVRKELLKLLGDISRKQGDTRNAIEMYYRCIRESRNGVVCQATKEIIESLEERKKND